MSAVWRIVRLTSQGLPGGHGPGGVSSPLEQADWEPSTPNASTTKSAPPTRDATVSKNVFMHRPDVERTGGPTGAPKGTGRRSSAAADSTTEWYESFSSSTNGALGTLARAPTCSTRVVGYLHAFLVHSQARTA